MSKGYSLHVGLERTSNRYARGRFPQLHGCSLAASAMEKIAEACGFGNRELLVRPENVTLSAICDRLRQLAKKALPTDLVLFTFAGHGDQVRDVDGDEPNGDQAMVLYDSMLVDDDVYEHLCAFQKGVRVVFVTDCCYGGSLLSYVSYVRAMRKRGDVPERPRTLTQPGDTGLAFGRARPEADILLLSACSDDARTPSACAGLPPFTRELVDVWNTQGGKFPGGYLELQELIRARGVDAELFPTEDNDDMLRAEPFAI